MIVEAKEIVSLPRRVGRQYGPNSREAREAGR